MVVMNMFWISRTRDHNEAHLGVPTQNDLNVGLVILLRQLGKDWFIDYDYDHLIQVGTKPSNEFRKASKFHGLRFEGSKGELQPEELVA